MSGIQCSRSHSLTCARPPHHATIPGWDSLSAAAAAAVVAADATATDAVGPSDEHKSSEVIISNMSGVTVFVDEGTIYTRHEFVCEYFEKRGSVQ